MLHGHACLLRPGSAAFRSPNAQKIEHAQDLTDGVSYSGNVSGSKAHAERRGTELGGPGSRAEFRCPHRNGWERPQTYQPDELIRGFRHNRRPREGPAGLFPTHADRAVRQDSGLAITTCR